MIIAALLLNCLGIVVIYSSEASLAFQQLIYSLIGVVFYLAISRVDFRIYRSIVRPLYILLLVFLVIAFLIGFETRGSVRWISLGLFNFQPSEFGKFVLIVVLANFWTKNLPGWKNILLSLVIFIPVGLLVFQQPDLGTALTLGFIWLVILIAANLSLIKLGIMGLLGALAIPGIWVFLKEYQKQRIYSFLFPNQDPLGIGYNVIQSTIAVGSGQIWGRGIGRGTQSRLQFLPEYRTDFIFASITEELGAIGSLIVLTLYSVIFYRIFKILANVGDKFGELVTVGVFGMLIFQMTVNIGMNIGILPVTGITLPLLSYGGSSVITVYMGLGLIDSVKKYGLKRRDADIFSL